MKNWISGLVILFLGISLVGCSTSSSPVPDNSKGYIGMFTGAIVGGLAGSAINQKGGNRAGAVALGAVVGALAGGALGMILVEKDREKADALAQKNASRADNWQNSSNPYAAPVQTAAKNPTVKTQIAEKKENPVVKKEVQVAKKEAVQEKDKKEVAAATTTTSKPLSLLQHMPSFQWFVNDVKQDEVG